MSEDTQKSLSEGSLTTDRSAIERLDSSLQRALNNTDDREARFHIRQALQFVEVVRHGNS